MSLLRRAQQQIAHTSTLPALGNKDLRSLQDVITNEKEFIKSGARAGNDWQRSAESLKSWGESEGEDLADITHKLCSLMAHYNSANTRFASHLATTRLHFKAIRTREETLAQLKNSKARLASRIEGLEKKLAKMGPENKELMKTTTDLKDRRNEMEVMSRELLEEEANIGDFKRKTVKEASGLKLGGLLEFAEKITIIAEVGKLMIEQIPLETTTPGQQRAPYYGHAKTEQLLSEATQLIADVGFAPGPSGGRPPRGSHLPDDSLDAGNPYNGQDNADVDLAREDTHATLPPSGADAAHWSSADARNQAEDQHQSGNNFDNSHLQADAQNVWTEERIQTPVDERVGRWQQDNVARPNGSAAGSRQNSTHDVRASAAYGGISYGADEDGPGDTQPSGPRLGLHDPSGAPTSYYSQSAAAPEASTGPRLGMHDPESTYYSHAPTIAPPRISTPANGSAHSHNPPTSSYAAAPSSPGANRQSATLASLSAAAASSSDFQPPSLPPVRTSSPFRSGGYEAPEGGRKVSAAAFRKGFNRNPSSSNVAAMGIGSGAAAHGDQGTYGGQVSSPAVGNEEGAEGTTAPLSIRRRMSSGLGLNVTDPVPPYADQSHNGPAGSNAHLA
ncbi:SPHINGOLIPID LONG CHAIN BASE-RESPONSIVE PROTEIN PIL1 [Ceraceosorus bombacis]|uniref:SPHINGOLIPID LONG CHAIN BASE-RESPONSIVE PROTEIN PIL1 n=1 Tax=Ceraceosorus bombacis TaxID=401625 RepID=A0A0P1BFS0_9BASI|nr:SPHINGOLIPID LONG CHAIN BASE-RESPONSIVE PROTEIN PIL1 [Ceraceosorus bombacis]